MTEEEAWRSCAMVLTIVSEGEIQRQAFSSDLGEQNHHVFVFCASRNAGRARITEMRRFPSHNYSSLSTHARFPGKPIGIGKENRTHAFCHGLSGSNWHSIRQARISVDLSHNLDPKSRSGAARRPPRG